MMVRFHKTFNANLSPIFATLTVQNSGAVGIKPIGSPLQVCRNTTYVSKVRYVQDLIVPIVTETWLDQTHDSVSIFRYGREMSPDCTYSHSVDGQGWGQSECENTKHEMYI